VTTRRAHKSDAALRWMPSLVQGDGDGDVAAGANPPMICRWQKGASVAGVEALTLLLQREQERVWQRLQLSRLESATGIGYRMDGYGRYGRYGSMTQDVRGAVCGQRLDRGGHAC
jgi:hypothetical protein